MSTYVIDYLSERRSLSLEAFVERHQEPVVAFKVPDQSLEQEEMTVARLDGARGPSMPRVDTDRILGPGPQTSTMSSLRTGDMLKRAAEGMLVVPIRKTGVNLYQDKITIGRATNNDVILPSNSVSKFHAYFRTDDHGGYTLTDSGSKNGTFVDWVRLDARKATPLRDGMEIIFGELSTRYYTPAGFYDFLARFLGG